MNQQTDPGCGCSKSRRRWRLIRWALVLAGLSLAAYMPYKATVQYDKLQDIYGPWFLQGAVVAAAGIFFFLKPAIAARTPLLLRAAVVVSALLWMRTGLQCTPHLWSMTQASLGKGLFAWLHMGTQHIFLSLGVVAFGIVPRALASRMGHLPAGETSADEPLATDAAAG